MTESKIRNIFSEYLHLTFQRLPQIRISSLQSNAAVWTVLQTADKIYDVRNRQYFHNSKRVYFEFTRFKLNSDRITIRRLRAINLAYGDSQWRFKTRFRGPEMSRLEFRDILYLADVAKIKWSKMRE